MKTFLYVLLFISICFAAGGHAPSRTAVDGMYELVEIDSTEYSGKIKFGDATGTLDTLDGADSVRACEKISFPAGWEYILKCDSLSGDSASADSIVQVLLSSYSGADSLLSHGILDTIPLGGCSIALPIGKTNLGIGSKFDIWIKSVGTSCEILIKHLRMYKRRPRQWQTTTQ